MVAETATAAEVPTATYEGMFILDSSRYQSASETLTNELMALLGRVGATVLAHRPWQDLKLAYPMNGHRKGLYYLTYFTMNCNQLTELERIVKLNENVLRHMILRLDPALVEPMVAMASGRGEIVSTFKDTEATDSFGGDSRGRR